MNKNSRKIIPIIGLSAFFIIIVAYAFFGSHNLIFGVRIKDVNLGDMPAESGIKVENGVLKITGNAVNATNLTINGREISINQDGNFNETITLLEGYNVMNITAKDKFGYVDEKNYKLILTEELGGLGLRQSIDHLKP